MDPRIADYIRENRRRYTRESLTKQLMSAGHDPGEIERTWAALDTPDADDVSGEGFWGRFALILVGINVGVFLLVGLLTGMLPSVAGGSIALLVILGVALVIGALIAWGIVAATGPTRLSRTTALVIGAAIPALFALLIGGACYALVGSLGGLGSGGPPPATGTMELRLEGAFELDQETSAFCQPDGGGGLFVSSEVVGADGRVLFVNISSFVEQPGGPLRPSLNIEAPPMDASESFPVWATEMGPAVEELDWELRDGGGSVMFRGLPGMDHGKGPAPTTLPPLSGEISWTCE